jgi:hypothetical protein
MSHLEEIALKHAKALGRAEAALAYIAAIADLPDEVRAAVADVQAEIARIIAEEDK